MWKERDSLTSQSKITFINKTRRSYMSKHQNYCY